MKPLVKYRITLESEHTNRIVKTWGVYPIVETKVLDGIYDPENEQLILLLDSSTEQYTTIRVLDNKNKSKIEQRKLDQYHRIKLTGEDIIYFLDTYVDNNFDIIPEIIDPNVNGEQIT